MIKTIFFDFDGVLATDANGLAKICENICAAVPGLPYDKVFKCYCTHAIPLLRNGGTHDTIWKDFCACVGTEIDIGILPSALRTVQKNRLLFDALEPFRNTFTFGIITENFTERMDLITKDLGLAEWFDPIIVSGDVHASKYDDSTAIYDIALKAAGCKAEEALFIENSEHNLIIPAKMGMHTYWHDDGKNDVDALVTALKEHITPF